MIDPVFLPPEASFKVLDLDRLPKPTDGEEDNAYTEVAEFEEGDGDNSDDGKDGQLG